MQPFADDLSDAFPAFRATRARGVSHALAWTAPAEVFEGTRAFDVLRAVVRSAVEGGWIHAGEPEAIAFLLWSACHGMIALEFRGRCKVLEDSLRAGISGSSYEYLLTSLSCEAPSTARPDPDRPAPRRRSRPES